MLFFGLTTKRIDLFRARNGFFNGIIVGCKLEEIKSTITYFTKNNMKLSDAIM